MAKFENTVRKYNERMKKDLQLEDVHTCGIWGNIGTETAGLTKLQEIKPLVQGSRGGYGWFQWTGPRRKKYEAFCKKHNILPADDESNYRYLVQETLTDEWKSLAQLRKTTTIDAATETFMLLNLRPGVQHLEDRRRWARKAADALKAKTATAVVAGAAIATGTVATVATYTPTNYLPYIAGGIALIAAIGAAIYFFKGK